MPPELQQLVHNEVQRTKERSGWPVDKTLFSLGVSRSTYYRWLQEEAGAALRGFAGREGDGEGVCVAAGIAADRRGIALLPWWL